MNVLHFHPGEWTDATRMMTQCVAVRGIAGSKAIGYGDGPKPMIAAWAEFHLATVRRWSGPGPLRYVVRVLQEILLGFWLARVARRERVDILHGHHAHCLIPCAVFGMISHRRLVYDTHDMPLHDQRNQGYGGLVWAIRRYIVEPFVVRRSDCCLHVSSGILNVYQAAYPHSRHLLLRNIPPELGTTDQPETSSARHSGDHLRLVYFGNIYPERLPFELMATLASDNGIVVDIYGDLPIWVVGIERYWSDFTKLIEGTGGRIAFRGRYSPSDIQSILANYDFSILPYELSSENVRYCMPNKFFQSLSSGLAVIVSGPSEMSALVSELNLGLWFLDGDMASFQTTIERAKREARCSDRQAALARAREILIDRTSYRRTVLQAYDMD